MMSAIGFRDKFTWSDTEQNQHPVRGKPGEGRARRFDRRRSGQDEVGSTFPGLQGLGGGGGLRWNEELGP